MHSLINSRCSQRWSRGHKARGQGHKKISRPRTDQGFGQTLLRPRAQTQVFSKKKRSSKFFFQEISKRKGLQNFFSGEKDLQKFFCRRSLLEETKKRSLQIFRKVSSVFLRNFSGSKIVLSSSRGQGKFLGLEALRPRPRPRTSKCVLEDILKTKDVLEDSTSGYWFNNSRLLKGCSTKPVNRNQSALPFDSPQSS